METYLVITVIWGQSVSTPSLRKGPSALTVAFEHCREFYGAKYSAPESISWELDQNGDSFDGTTLEGYQTFLNYFDIGLQVYQIDTNTRQLKLLHF
jgi:hypothetical protein